VSFIFCGPVLVYVFQEAFSEALSVFTFSKPGTSLDFWQILYRIIGRFYGNDPRVCSASVLVV